MLRLDDFIRLHAGKKLDWDNAYNGQCVDLFRFYLHDVLDFPQPRAVTGAADFWTNYTSDPVLKDNFTKIPNTPDFIPQKGDVMIWNKRAGGGFGHIAVVADNQATTSTFTSFDQNWRALNVCELTTHDYKNVYGVLRPVQSIQEPMPEDTVAVKKTDFEVLVTKSSQLDELVKKGVTEDRFDELKRELDGEKEALKALKKEFQDFIDRIASLLGSTADKEGVIKFATNLGHSLDDVEKYKDLYEREIQTGKKAYEEYQIKLGKFDESLHEMRGDFEEEKTLLIEELERKYMKRIDQLQAQVEKEIEKARISEEALKTVTRFSSFWKWVVSLNPRKGTNA